MFFLLIPYLGMFFLLMIIIVSASVVATIVVIHMNQISCRPPPGWVSWLALKKLPPLVCLNGIRNIGHPHTRENASLKASEDYVVPNVISVGVSAFSGKFINDSNSSAPSVDFEVQMEEEKQNQHEWKSVSLVLDRLLMVVFITTNIVITVALLSVIVIGSNQELHYEVEKMHSTWKNDTFRSLIP